mmetsp:Transcript_4805/g.8239  ORF Transcript_4805/g.8239 Transcript_4805/m.8239 type:complete len:82 (+) Transcript_4805:1203-1448(+)
MPNEFSKFDKLVKIYAYSDKMVDQIRAQHDAKVHKELFDLAMRKVTVQAELEMINIELKQLIEERAGEVDLSSLGLDMPLG